MRDGLAVGNVLAGDQHIGDIALDSHFKKVVAEKTQQGVEVVSVGVVDDKEEDHRHEHQHWHADGVLALIN